jgi:hypothetical protein
MTYQIEKFSEPKRRFSARVNAKPRKQLEFESDVASVMSFEEALEVADEYLEDEDVQEFLKKVKDIDSDDDFDQKSLRPQERNQIKDAEKADAVIDSAKVLRELSKIKSGVSFLPTELIARIEITGTKGNYERIDDEDYVNYAEKLSTPFYSSEEIDELAQQIFGSSFYEELLKEAFPAEENTLPHNTNLYGRDTNIFRKSDALGRHIYQNSEYFSSMHNEILGTRGVLDDLYPGFYQDIQNVMNEIQDMKISKGAQAAFANPNVKNDDNDLNWEMAVDPYSDSIKAQETMAEKLGGSGFAGEASELENELKEAQAVAKEYKGKFDIEANNNTILMSGLWGGFDNKQSFSFINSLWEDMGRFNSMFSGITGPANALNKLVENENAMISEESVFLAADEDVRATLENRRTDGDDSLIYQEGVSEEVAVKEIDAIREAKLMDNMLEWWGNVEGGMTEVSALTVGMALSSAPTIMKLMDFSTAASSNGNSLDSVKNKNEGFKEKMVKDYFEYINEEYVQRDFLAETGVTAAQFRGADKSGKGFWDLLVNNDYIDNYGRVLRSFDAQDSGFFEENGLSEEQGDLIVSSLNQAKLGGMSLDNIDRTLVGDLGRKDIKIEGNDGNSRSLRDVISLIGTGRSEDEILDNTFQAYDSLFDIYCSMTGLSENGGKKDGKPIVKELENGLLEVSCYPNASWEEWNPEMGQVDDSNGAISNGSWEKKTGPLTMRFENQQELDSFVSQVRGLIAMVEPSLGLFSSKSTPLRLLRDNEGSVDSINMIKNNEEGYKVWVDTRLNTDVFETDTWTDCSRALNKKIVSKVSQKITLRMQTNKILKMKHENDTDSYQERKKEHEENEYEKFVRSIKDDAKKRGERKAAIKRTEAFKKAMAAKAMRSKKGGTKNNNKKKKAKKK